MHSTQIISDFLTIFYVLMSRALILIAIFAVSIYIGTKATKPSTYKKVYRATNGHKTKGININLDSKTISISKYKTSKRTA